MSEFDAKKALADLVAQKSVWEAEAQVLESPDDVETELERLAGLSTLTYERERIEAAKALGMRTSILDEVVKARRTTAQDAGGLCLEDPEPWPEPVGGAELLDELTTAVKRYVSLPAGAPEAIALWMLHSHSHNAADVSPILAVTSPTPECGKTTLLTFLQAITPRALSTANITAAALFRAVEKYEPTLLIDEADTFLRDNDDLRGVLNSGHARGSAYVIRTVGEDHEPRQFRTWAPKALALIGRLPATLASRSIHIELQRLAPGESVEPLRLHRMDVFEPLRRQASRWAADNLEDLRPHEPDIPPELYGRSADNWRSLLSIADAAGGDWPQRARLAAVSLSAAGSEQTAGVLLLEDLRRLFSENGDRLATTTILDELHEMEDRPWPEWKRGKELSARGLAKLLNPFGVSSRAIKFRSGDVAKGYRLDQLEDAFRRYLPPSEKVTTSPSAHTAENSHSQKVTGSNRVTDTKSRNPAPTAEGNRVTDTTPPSQGETDAEPIRERDGVTDREPPAAEGENAAVDETPPSAPSFADEEESTLPPEEVLEL